MQISSLFNNKWTLVTVGTVAVACLIASLMPAQYPGVSFLSAQQSDVEKAFIQYIAQHGRSYASKEEYPQRFEIFSANYKKVMEHNANPEATFKLGFNHFSDRLESEKPARGIFLDQLPEDTDAHPVHILEQNPTSLDWRTTMQGGLSVIAPVLNQMSCGCCY